MAESARLEGKTVLLTGGTMGIGKAAAVELARLGAELTLVGRNPSKLDPVVKEVAQASGNPKVEGMLADLASQAQIRKLAADFRAKHRSLHVLINNAGAIYTDRQESPDGIELTFALNHLAYFLLTVELLDLLKRSEPARVINVSSDAHWRGKIDFDDLQAKKGYSSWTVYSDSKLANVAFTKELARRLKGTGVTANCMHPGFTNSGWGKNTHGLFRVLMSLSAPFQIRPETAARTVVYLASSPNVANVTGQYFAKSKPARSKGIASNPEVGRRLWEVSEQLTAAGKVP